MGIQHRDISLGNMMFKRIDGKIRGYLIDFDLASLAGRDSHNLDRTGTMPFMALELLKSVGRGQAPILHAYAHDAEAVCWVVLWLGVQYAAGRRMRHSFGEWEMVDAVTCYQKKRYAIENPHLHPFTKPNEHLQQPIRDILAKINIHHLQKLIAGGEIPLPDIGGWVDGCDKAIRAQVPCIS
jgi:serine/threonine protein kinase